MSDIIVYESEKRLGLEEKIKAQSSIAFLAEVGAIDDHIIDQRYKKFSDFISHASENDPDLYHVFSILVSTTWNKNDDIFSKEEVWASRNTPRFKPTNVEHDENKIVGGIINSWPVDKDYNLIAEDIGIEDIPDEFHILVSSVIYRQWQSPELKAMAEELIAEIEAGEKFVSMECIFRGFDYGVIDPNGNNHIVARNEQTSFLTQHLRAYGGAGEYQGHKLGRVLRSITFSGKGYVARPANDGSIVFNKDRIFSFANVTNDENLFFNKNGVTNNTDMNEQVSYENNEQTEINIMSDVLNDQIKELKEAMASLKTENKELSNKLAEANISGYEDKIAKLEETVAKLNAEIESLQGQVSEASTANESLKQELENKTKAYEEVQAAMDGMKEEKKKKERKDQMAKCGLSEDEVEKKYELFASLSDDQFNVIVETLAAANKPAETTSEESSEASEEESEETTSASEVVETEGTEEGNHSLSGEGEDQLSNTRAALQAWVETCIMSK